MTATDPSRSYPPVQEPPDDPVFPGPGTLTLDLATLAAMDADPFGDGPLPRPRRPRTPYDPGQPRSIRKVGPGLYDVPSFRDAAPAPYRVDLNARTCTCPHFTQRLASSGRECKHLGYARTEARRLCLARALFLSPEELKRQSNRTDLRPEIRESIRIALGCKPRGSYARI